LTGERVTRRLAAILAADVVGYSRLMGRDEHGTLTRLKAHRAVRLEPTLARHGGRLVKLMGDGALVEFPSAVDALGAAIEFQQAMEEANRDQPEETRLVFRIGLHLGDLIVDGDDLYGDGVNVAARLEAEAPPGGIVISGNVHDAAAGRLKATFDDLGSLALKNIERPVQAFGVKWDAEGWKSSTSAIAAPSIARPSTTEAPLSLPDKPSIAVLPFQNMGGDPEQEYFADGMVEDIITALSRFNSLFVIARNSSFTYKGKTVDIKQVGRELGVRYVLEGSVRKSGRRLRITGQLIDSETGTHLWAERFDGSLEDVFGLQDEMTMSVVGAIAPKLNQIEMERAKRKPADNLDAYDCFLKGLALSFERTRESNDESLRLFHRAIEIDAGYAAPYGLAAMGLNIRKVQGWIVDREREDAEVRRLAIRVSAIGKDDALALCCAGHALVNVCREYDTGAAMIDQALYLNQNLAVGWFYRGLSSAYAGLHEAAIEQIARALRLSPLDPETYPREGIMAQAYLLLGRYDDAVNWATKALSRQSNWMPALRAAAAANALAGNVDEARKIMLRMRRQDPAMTLSNFQNFTAFRQSQDVATWINGLRLAGMPE
jgi:TolB-like protein/class 3 adenylate cyclase